MLSVERTPGAQGVGFRLSAGRCTASNGAAKHGWRNDRDTMMNRCCDITKPFRQPRRSRRPSGLAPRRAAARSSRRVLFSQERWAGLISSLTSHAGRGGGGGARRARGHGHRNSHHGSHI